MMVNVRWVFFRSVRAMTHNKCLNGTKAGGENYKHVNGAARHLHIPAIKTPFIKKFLFKPANYSWADGALFAGKCANVCCSDSHLCNQML